MPPHACAVSRSQEGGSTSLCLSVGADRHDKRPSTVLAPAISETDEFDGQSWTEGRTEGMPRPSALDRGRTGPTAARSSQVHPQPPARGGATPGPCKSTYPPGGTASCPGGGGGPTPCPSQVSSSDTCPSLISSSDTCPSLNSSSDTCTSQVSISSSDRHVGGGALGCRTSCGRHPSTASRVGHVQR
jgi:hypothetical protein